MKSTLDPDTPAVPDAAPFEPHPVLAPHYQSKTEKQRFLRGIFDRAAPFYEGIASWGFLGTGDFYRRDALKRHGLERGLRVVDVATGTGPTARAAAHLAGGASHVVCVEPSLGMLRESLKQLPALHLQAGADHLPLRSNQFDFLTMGFALRHVESLEGAFREFCRVLKPGGRAVILDITKPESRLGQRLCRLYFRDVMPRLTRWVTGNADATYLMEYYWETLDNMVPPPTVLEALRAAGFVEARRHVVLGMFSEYSAQKPSA